MGDLKMYDCRKCWAVFTEHTAFTFFSYNCCDKSVFRSIVTCEKEQKLWTDFKFCHFTLFRSVWLWVCLQMFCLWPAKAHYHFRKSQKNKKNTFFQTPAAKIWNVPSWRKVWLFRSMLLWHTQKNIVSMLVYKIYNRFILVCWCEKNF